MSEVTVVRCPKCGSTNAGEDGGAYELTLMRCRDCGHSEHCDDYQIKDDWNAEVELPMDAASVPAMLPSLAEMLSPDRRTR